MSKYASALRIDEDNKQNHKWRRVRLHETHREAVRRASNIDDRHEEFRAAIESEFPGRSMSWSGDVLQVEAVEADAVLDVSGKLADRSQRIVESRDDGLRYVVAEEERTRHKPRGE